MPIACAYFDGASARRHEVDLDIVDGRVVVGGDGIARDEPLDAMQFSQALGATARIVRFPDGATCEVTDVAALGAMLTAAGIAETRVAAATNAKRLVAIGVAVIVVTLALGYRYGVPVAAGFVAHRLPVPVLTQLGRQTLSTLDSIAFAPSDVPLEHGKPRSRRSSTRFGMWRRVACACGFCFARARCLAPTRLRCRPVTSS